MLLSSSSTSCLFPICLLEPSEFVNGDDRGVDSNSSVSYKSWCSEEQRWDGTGETQHKGDASKFNFSQPSTYIVHQTEESEYRIRVVGRQRV